MPVLFSYTPQIKKVLAKNAFSLKNVKCHGLFDKTLLFGRYYLSKIVSDNID